MENYQYFVWYFHENRNYFQDKSLLFSLDLKASDVTPVYKKKSKSFKDKYRPVSITFNIFNYIKDAFTINFNPNLTKLYLNTNGNFVKVIIRKTV